MGQSRPSLLRELSVGERRKELSIGKTEGKRDWAQITKSLLKIRDWAQAHYLVHLNFNVF